MKDFTIGVIISTYNNARWLEKTLWGYRHQTVAPDEIVIADDGSDDRTRALIRRYSEVLPLRHVWHEDKGFRKTVILNKAITESKADYLIFTDQDCVPRRDFVETHRAGARRGHFLSGGYFKLPMDISEALTEADIASGEAFTLPFLIAKGLKKSFKMTKLFGSKPFARMMNAITPAKASWNGMNSSGWREDIVRANGFDERMQYGGEDRELGERLVNAGIRPVQIRYSAITLHLDHSRPYVNAEAWETNNEIRRQTARRRLTRTPCGLVHDKT